MTLVSGNGGASVASGAGSSGALSAAGSAGAAGNDGCVVMQTMNKRIRLRP